ncbi:MAG: glucosaminidase domain-containing protein [Saprospiraceae bacterium]|nr:glucosaminidase domain-containing protein [Saprospiraceae bacterium]
MKVVLQREANNHFGIKLTVVIVGPTYFKVDDDFDTDGKNIESCFRVYKDASESYEAIQISYRPK